MQGGVIVSPYFVPFYFNEFITHKLTKDVYYQEPRTGIRDPTLAAAYLRNNRQPTSLDRAHAIMVKEVQLNEAIEKERMLMPVLWGSLFGV